MNVTFSDMLNKFVIIYLDDILVYSKDLGDHVKHLDLVLARLQKSQLAAKLSKCEFGM